eukprot:scaffold12430_cov137-Skeletonema_marinoi.AAC.2
MTAHVLPDEMIANVLHTLNNANVSPLPISCKTKPTGSAKWDLLQSCEELHRTVPTHHNFFASLLELFLSGHDDMNLSDAFRVFNVETTVTNDEGMVSWIQGLSVLHSIISSEDTILAPHELLTTVKDSYYCRDDDERDLPTFDSMFILRSLLSAHAIQSVESRTRHSLQHSETIRWRRLKSMVEDTIALFQRMLFEGFEIVNDSFENDTQSQPGKDYPTKPTYFISIASWIYTKQIFPACEALVSLLLEEDHEDGIVNLKDGLVAKVFGMLTTLVALECRSTPSGDLNNTDRLVFAAITASEQFFSYVRSYGEPQESGPSLEEDLLLYDRPQCNKLGQAALAFFKLRSQLYPSNDAAIPFPSPLSAEHRWTLSFPHVITFLADDSHVKFGFDMLQMLVNGTHFIQPAQYGTYSNSALQRAHSSELLAQTLHTLLSLVLRISALEATMPNSSYSSVVKYSSLQVMSLAQSLKALYITNVQVQAIAEVSQMIRDSDQGLIALLPKVLDWVRPVVMGICNKCKDSCQNSDLILLCEVIRVLDPILKGLEEVFDDSSTLPKNIPAFLSMIEAYTALFSSLRAIHTGTAPIINTTNDVAECAQLISEWLSQSLDRLILFKERLEKLIDLWSAGTEASSPPPGHHRCLLLHYHLEEVVLKLSGED